MKERLNAKRSFAAILILMASVLYFSISCQAAGRGGQLKGINKYVYGVLKEHIINVAAGKEWNTTFTIELPKEIAHEYTAADLGLGKLAENGVVSQKARNALSKKLNYNLDRIMDCLMADHPYELYWYDKLQTIPSNWYKNGVSSVPVTLGNNSLGQEILEIDDVITLSLPVSEEYAKSKYQVQREACLPAKEAIANAKKIRDKYAGRSDQEKLTAYCIEICKRTSYNKNPKEKYGNPWQMIWVFDQNKKNQVQCEGYAKAFQYLCDISNFSNKISCFTVTGTIKSGKTTRKHMWNIVTMQNGKRYLADITNCDGQSYYFLPGYQGGSVKKGYIYRLNNRDYCYSYDTSTYSIYSLKELTMSSSWYMAGSGKKSKVEKLFLSGISHRVAAGKSIRLKAVVEPLYAYNRSVRWESSNKKVATVTRNGRVKIKKGSGGRSVVITAVTKDGSKKKRTWRIRVMKDSVRSIKLKTARKKLKVGQSMKLKVKVKASRRAYKALQWASSNNSYARVSQKGMVTAQKAGRGHTVTISVKTRDGSNKKKSIRIRIK